MGSVPRGAARAGRQVAPAYRRKPKRSHVAAKPACPLFRLRCSVATSQPEKPTTSALTSWERTSRTVQEAPMTRLPRLCIAALAAGLAVSAQAGAAPPGEVVIERTTL